MTGSGERVGELVRALCAHHVGEARAETATRAAARLLASALRAAPSLRDSETVVRAVITRLVRDGRHPDATRYAQLAAGLRFEPSVSDSAAWAALYVLAALRDTEEGPRQKMLHAFDPLAPAPAGDHATDVAAASDSALSAEAAAALPPPRTSVPAAPREGMEPHTPQRDGTDPPSVFVPPVHHRNHARHEKNSNKHEREKRNVGKADRVGDSENLGSNSDDDNDDTDDSDENEDDEDYYDADGRPTAAALRGRARGNCAAVGGDADGGFVLGPKDAPFTPAHRQAVLTRRPAMPQADASASVTPRSVEVLLVRDVMLIVQGESGTYVRFPPASDARDDMADVVDEHFLTAHGTGLALNERDPHQGLSSAERQRVMRDMRRRIAEDKLAVEILPFPSADLVMSPASVHMVRYIAELGFLFNVIRRRMRTMDSNPGLVASNFCNAVDREMEAYYRSLAAFQAEPSASLATGGHALNWRDQYAAADDKLPSLRTVYVWAEAEKPRLRWLARLCDETEGLVGGQTLAHLRRYRKSYVAEDIRGLLSRIIARTASPLDLMLIRWITEGVLVDPHGEFYIMEDPKVAAAAAAATAAMKARNNKVGGEGVGMVGTDHLFDGLAGGPNAASAASHRIWWGLFKVRRDMIPGVQSRAVVENTLTAGKSIAFLRRCCGDSAWVDQVHAPAMAAYLAEYASSYVSPEASAQASGRSLAIGAGLLDQDPRIGKDHVAELVRRAVRSSSMRLKTLFFDKFDLSHHFAAIKNYLLLSQGDFTQALMDSLAPLLDGDGRILRNNITGLLDTALRTSSSFNPDTDADIAERLDVQILPQADNDSVGWDVFSLTYRVEDAPLNTVFSTKVMDAYLQIFRFLWRLKRMDYVLSAAYLDLRELDSAWRRRRRRRARASRGRHGSSKRILSTASGADAVDEEDEEAGEQRRRAAEEDAIGADLVNRAHFLRMRMTHVLQNMQYYCTFEVLEGNWQVLSDEMSRAEDIDSLIHAHARYLAAIKDRTLLSDRSKHVSLSLDAVLVTILAFGALQREICALEMLWGSGGDAAAELLVSARSLAERLCALELRFVEVFRRFLGDLGTHAQMVDSCVFLVFRLDYNSYYARQQDAGWSGAVLVEKKIGGGIRMNTPDGGADGGSLAGGLDVRRDALMGAERVREEGAVA